MTASNQTGWLMALSNKNEMAKRNLKHPSNKKDYTKLVTWLIILGITVTIWGTVLHWLVD